MHENTHSRLVPLGYLLVLLPPLLVTAGALWGLPWLTLATFIAASPITRAIFGSYPRRGLDISERTASILNALPVVYGIVLLASLVAAALVIPSGLLRDMPDLIWFGASLWTALTFGTFPAHELIHQPGKGPARAGSFVAGLCGYPILGIEHVLHHRSPGSTETAEWPARHETMWAFVARRSKRVIIKAFRSDASLRATGEWGMVSPLVAGMTGFAVALLIFGLLGGSRGVAVYLCAAFGVAFSMQVMTYVQHWGLGTDSFPDGGTRELAWEDDCMMQAWLTMNNSFHHAHHLSRDTVYFFIEPSGQAPRQPGCYVVALCATMVPAVWKWLMEPVLESWKLDPNNVCQPGRRVICIIPSRRELQTRPTTSGVTK